jgi:hypothetical protein
MPMENIPIRHKSTKTHSAHKKKKNTAKPAHAVTSIKQSVPQNVFNN